jgi:hypothetical protein
LVHDSLCGTLLSVTTLLVLAERSKSYTLQHEEQENSVEAK